MNRRVFKTTSGGTLVYAYDGSRVVEEFATSGRGGTLLRSYYYGDYVDEPVALRDATSGGGGFHYYVQHRQYHVMALVDASGAVVERYGYGPFGLLSIDDGAGTPRSVSAYGNPFGYTGQRYDAESVLWHYKGRAYAPVFGRFLQRDPAGYVDGYHLYAYVANNPLRDLDPSGASRIWGGASTSVTAPVPVYDAIARQVQSSTMFSDPALQAYLSPTSTPGYSRDVMGWELARQQARFEAYLRQRDRSFAGSFNGGTP